MFKHLSAFVIMLVITTPTWAARPLSTDDSGTVALGHFEIEEGYTFNQSRDRRDNSSSLGTSIKYGLLSKLDIGIEASYSTASPSGLGDAILKGKFRIIEESPRHPSLALRADIKLANGDVSQSLGSGYLDYSLHGILSKELGLITGHLDLGYTLVGVAPKNPSANVFSYGLALVYPFGEKANLTGEVVGSSTEGAITNPLDVLVGGSWSAVEWLTLDGGISLGFTDTSSQYKGTIGLTVRL